MIVAFARCARVAGPLPCHDTRDRREGAGWADWPAAAAQDRYTSPWNRPTATTILVVDNTGDPWIPCPDSVATSRDLARARPLTVDGYGHTAGNNPSACAINDIVGYTMTGTLPASGTVC